VIDATSMVLGPLASPECTRAARRGWLIWVRLFPAVASCAVAFVVLWVWWIGQQIDPYHQPFFELHTGLSIVEGMLVSFALILSPAVLAGSLAGEKERGSIGLLLTTRVTSSDIVLGKLASRLSQVLMIELAATPGLLLFASLAGMGPLSTFTLFALPMWAWRWAAGGSRWRPRRSRGGAATRSCWSTSSRSWRCWSRSWPPSRSGWR
jgi:hypothetical protein